MRGDEYFDAAGSARGTADKSATFEGKDHLVDGGGTDREMALDVRLCGWASLHARVGVDEGQVLALRVREGRH